VHIARVALRVSSLDESIGFYRLVGGLAVRNRDGERVTMGAPAGGPTLIELRRAARPGRAPRGAAGLFHTALRFPTRAALGAALRRVVEARQPLSGASDHLVSEALYLDDPDGMGVELYCDRPREQWPDRGSGAFMPTLPLDLDDVLAAAGNGAEGVVVGHVHLKVADVAEAIGFWSGAIGMELTMRLGDDAAFLADGGYHHHVGANTWLSRGAAREPDSGPGLDAVVVAVDGDRLDATRERLATAGAPVREREGSLQAETPDGVPVLLERG
jgi:catechol 2,3-dioxygenase